MKAETRVGLLFVSALILLGIFAYFMGILNPFSNANQINVMYNFAGGIEVGSPVRVMGIKVGKVDSIHFEPGMKMANGEEVNLRIVISVEKKAWSAVREDSKYFINLAGVIGEKFLEITPGSSTATEMQAGSTVRGEDPPRIDQLISQGYGLAGKLLSMVENNEGSITHVIKQLDGLVSNVNKTLILLDKASQNPKVARLLDNTVKISDDLAHITGDLRSKKAEETFDLVNKLLWRLEPLDGPQIRKFLQDEGIRAKMF